MYWHRYTEEELEWLCGLARKSSGFLFFNNVWMGEDALRFKGVCGNGPGP